MAGFARYSCGKKSMNLDSLALTASDMAASAEEAVGMMSVPGNHAKVSVMRSECVSGMKVLKHR